MSPAWTRRPVDVDGHQVMTFTAGTGPRTVLLVHGDPGCPSRYLRDSHAALVDRGFKLVTWDQLGCGGQIPSGLVQAAVTYYGEYRSEIDAEIAFNEAEYERGRAAAIADEQTVRG